MHCSVLVDTTPFWCTVIYFEEGRCVGENYNAFTSLFYIDGYASPDLSDRFSVGRFTNIHRTRTVESVRNRIGKGIRLELTHGMVVLTNVGKKSVFVFSGILNMMAGKKREHIFRVASGEELIVFKYQKFMDLFPDSVDKGFMAIDQLKHFCLISVSFGKGWGSGYRRSRVTELPCWVQINFTWAQAQLDYVLSTLSPDEEKPSSSS